MLNKTKRAIVTAAIVATLGASAFAGVATTFAANTAGQAGDHMSNLVTAIATKFNLNKDDVQAVFDEQKDQMHADMEAKVAAHISDAVTAGKLTQAQADAITAKQAEIDTFLQSQESKTPAEREAAMKTEMDSLKAWAKSNNIPKGFAFPHFLGHPPMGGHHFGKFAKNHQTATTDDSTNE